MKKINTDKNIIFIFDFDGVIVNTISALYQVYLDFLLQFGFVGNKTEFDILNGPKLSEIIFYLKSKYDLKDSNKFLLDNYQKRLNSIYERAYLNEGIELSLKYLKKLDYKIVLASSSIRSKIDKVLTNFDLNDYFDFIITGDDVSKAKPDSEIYEKVKNKFTNYSFYVIEDSFNGLKAAKLANLKTIYYNDNETKLNISVDYEIKSFLDLPKIIREIDLNCYLISQSKPIKFELDVDLKKINLNYEEKKLVESFWNSYIKNKNIFNGSIINLNTYFEKDKYLNINFSITQYKYFISQLKLFDFNLGIYPISVSGIIIDEYNNTLIAKRKNVSQYEEYFELIPSGSIDTSKIKDNKIDFESQLINEFQEETNLEINCIKNIEYSCFIFDKTNQVYDICSKIKIKGNLNYLKSSFISEEYDEISIINLKNINSFNVNKFVPTSRIFLDNLDLPL